MNPITWQNIGGPSLAEASRPLDSAANAFNMGFGALNNVLQQRNAINDQNVAAIIKNNTNTEMNNLMGINSVDDFKAKLGTLGQTLNGYGAMIDQEKLRQFADNRTATLQDRTMKDSKYKDFMLDDEQAGTRDRLAGMLASGDKAQIEAAMKELPNVDLRVKSDLYQRGNEAQRQLIDRAHVDEKHKWDGEKLRADINNMAAMQSIARGTLEVNRRQVTVQEAQAMAQQQDRLAKLIDSKRQQYQSTYSNDAGTEEGQKRIAEALKTIEDPADRKQARIMIGQAQAKYPNAPVDVLINVARGIDASYALDMYVRGQGVKAVGEAIGTKDLSSASAANELRRAQLRDDITSLYAQRDKLSGTNKAPASTGTVTSTTVDSPFNMASPPATTAPVTQAPSAVQAPAKSSMTPSEQIDANYTRAMAAYDQKYGKNPFTPEAQAARQQIYADKVAAQENLKNAAKEAAKTASQAQLEAANKVNAENAARQEKLNADALTRENQRAVNKLDSKIAELQSNLKVYQNRGSVRDGIEIDDTNKKLSKAIAERERLKKLLNN